MDTVESSDALTVNLADPQDIRRQLPNARALYEAKLRDLEALQLEVEGWAELINILAQRVGEPGIPKPAPSSNKSGRRKGSPAQDRAINALRAYGSPVGPTELFRYMLAQDMDAPNNANTLGASLWTASKAGKVVKTSHGLYALPEWETDSAAANGDGSPPKT